MTDHFAYWTCQPSIETTRPYEIWPVNCRKCAMFLAPPSPDILVACDRKRRVQSTNPICHNLNNATSSNPSSAAGVPKKGTSGVGRRGRDKGGRVRE